MQSSILQLKDISKVYPGTIALESVNLAVRKGEVHGIIGKNGAGKSTLVSIIAGIIAPTTGDIVIGDKSFKTLSRNNARDQLISIVTQEPQVIRDCTIAENLFMPDYASKGFFINWNKINSMAQTIISKAGLNIDASMNAGDLSISEQQLLLVVKACYVEKSQIIILDEVSASLTQDDEKLLYEIIQKRKSEGCTIIYISHRTDELLNVCDRVTVIRDGKAVTTKECAQLSKKELSHLIVGDGYTSTAVTNDLPVAQGKSEEVVFKVNNLTKYGQYQDISFSLKKGEILGFAGLRGSGRTEIFKGIVGIDPADDGSITIKNETRRFKSPAEAFKSRVLYLPEDRDKEGLINCLSVRENLTLNILPRISHNTVIKPASENDCVAGLIDMLDIKTFSPEQEVNELSGGNKQKVIVGKIMAAEPLVCILDEPTRGVDIAAKEGILSIIKNRMSKYSSVIITSPGIEDLVEICDRILVLYQGNIIAEFTAEEFDEKVIYHAQQGERKVVDAPEMENFFVG
ncbi:sugar ABC transporter ATP-binding protein [Sporomusa sp. KB1]|jgi:ABC-type sugar transport system ATPase subunit|uniref:sugar ABC transporter ATP-binding protein n=1 Tax=Sporomusa sp. KB1 TaxID=943346 RepID=UPI0011A58D48|nr:sugar ABC transporter ATP-binding protein [Sporomusa sp. KB1]TWH46251.1 monosaccharide ABC transporter ATP-binding protein (CUT2 family) [Sporomusa sp. KB1]